MKQTFKRIICTVLALCLLCALAVTAMAAEPSAAGVYNVQGLTPKTAENAAPATEQITVDGQTYTLYVGAERFQFPFTADANTQCLVLLLKGKTLLPTVDTIFYIDQKMGSEAPFDLFPKPLEEGDYTVWMTTMGGTKPETAAASFSYYNPAPAFLPGDADGDDKVTIMDATKIMRYLVYHDTISEKQLLAADADGDGSITIMDATKVMRHLVYKDVLGKVESAN